MEEQPRRQKRNIQRPLHRPSEVRDADANTACKGHITDVTRGNRNSVYNCSFLATALQRIQQNTSITKHLCKAGLRGGCLPGQGALRTTRCLSVLLPSEPYCLLLVLCTVGFRSTKKKLNLIRKDQNTGKGMAKWTHLLEINTSTKKPCGVLSETVESWCSPLRSLKQNSNVSTRQWEGLSTNRQLRSLQGQPHSLDQGLVV